GVRFQPRSRSRICDRRNELISPFAQRFNVRRLIRPVAQDSPDFEDSFLYHLRIYMSVSPNGFENLILGDEPRFVLDQKAEHIERLRCHRQAFIRAPETAIDCVEAEWLEHLHLDDLPVPRCSCASSRQKRHYTERLHSERIGCRHQTEPERSRKVT